MDRLSRLTVQHRHIRVLATRKAVVTALLAGGLLIAPAAGWAMPVALPATQEEAPAATNTPQVIAQGIARLPSGAIGWTLQRVDVTGNTATPVAAFPLGFILSDDASVVVLTEDEIALGVLDYGEAIFLDGGPGGIAPWRDDAASLYELALIPQEAAESTTATVIGDFFQAPEGRGAEIELARGVLGNGMESTVPGSRSGTPTLLLQTSGAAELVSENGQPVVMTAGQFALLDGSITVRGAGDEPATFVVASIGEPAPARAGNAPAGAGANRANRATRANAGGASGGNAGGGGGGGRGNQQAAAQGGGSSAPSDEAAMTDEDRRAARAARQAERAARQAAGTPTPVTETDTETDAGTPTPVEQDIATPDDATTDEEDEIIVDQDFNDDDDSPNVIEVTEPTPTPTPIPPVDQAPPAEETTPPDETTPAEDVPAEPPVEEVPSEDPVEQVPAEDVPPAEGTSTEDVAAAERIAPVEEAPIVEEVPVEAAAIEEVPVEQVPVEEAPAADPAADPAAQG